MTITRHLALALACLLVAACGSVTKGDADARPPDPDAPPEVDAGPDAPPPPPPTGDVRDLGPVGGRVAGGGFVLDLQLGHPFDQRAATGGGRVLEGAAAVKRP